MTRRATACATTGSERMDGPFSRSACKTPASVFTTEQKLCDLAKVASTDVLQAISTLQVPPHVDREFA